MDAEQLRIDRLILRLPGRDRDAARALGREVIARLTADPPVGLAPRRLARLRVRLEIPPGVSGERIADLVAERIREALR